jgi:hypothetical protein
MSQTKFSLAGIILIMVRDIPAGDGKIANLFFPVNVKGEGTRLAGSATYEWVCVRGGGS